jgi:predicted DCC family thiol-disulfide oxidoreductase YuxK
MAAGIAAPKGIFPCDVIPACFAEMETQSGGILLFDGDCTFCASSVRFIIRHERKPLLSFAPRKSSTGTELCRLHGIEPDGVNSMILILDGGRVLTHSDAVLAVAGLLKHPWSLASVLRFIPRWPRDAVYGFVSRNRQRFAQGNRGCELPGEEGKGRFLG